MVITYCRDQLLQIRQRVEDAKIRINEKDAFLIRRLQLNSIPKTERGKRSGLKLKLKQNDYPKQNIEKRNTKNDIRNLSIRSSSHTSGKTHVQKRNRHRKQKYVFEKTDPDTVKDSFYQRSRHRIHRPKKPCGRKSLPIFNKFTPLAENVELARVYKDMPRQPNQAAGKKARHRERSHKAKQISETQDLGNSKELQFLTMGLWNAQSVHNKTDIVVDNIFSDSIDMYFITESWLYSSDIKTIGDLTPQGYKTIHVPRDSKRGGGVLCTYRDTLDVKRMKTIKLTTMEIMEVMVTANRKKIRIVTIYRPEPTSDNRYTMSAFYEEFSELMMYYHLTKEELIICGDFNFHVNKPTEHKPMKFLKILEDFDLKQHINEATHKNGNTLDLIITRKENIVKQHLVDLMLSDHRNILVYLDISKPKPSTKVVKSRKLHSINKAEFRADIQNLVDESKSIDTLDSIVKHYNETGRHILDKHAPEQKRNIILRKPNPWTTDDIRPEKKQRRKFERKWRKSKLTVDFEAFREQKNKVNNTLMSMRKAFYSKLISENAKKPRELFKSINKALHRKEELPLPPDASESVLANRFSDYFESKISKIRMEIDQVSEQGNKSYNESKMYAEEFTEFESLTEEEVKELFQNAPNKYCDLDPLPTWLLKENIDIFLPMLTRIINLSLALGDMPDDLKHAVIRPLLKKLGQELIEKNYRPVSNLAFLSKLIERAVAQQLISHLHRNKLMDIYQSAYRQYHSTETALLRLQNDVLAELDEGNCVMLVMLDMSAAFDTIDHEILLCRLQNRCGIKGTALKWFRSYLSRRTQSVLIGDTQSSPKTLKYGVPQGSVLGPILFSIYTSPLGDIIRKHNIKYKIYADDNDLYMSFSPSNKTIEDRENQIKSKKQMENCATEVGNFLVENKMKKNDDKTEFSIFGLREQLKKVQFNTIQMGETNIEARDIVKNLGVRLNKDMTNQSQVDDICKVGYYNIRQLWQIRDLMNDETAKLAAHAFVSSILDYGNSLLYGLPKYQLQRLQVLQIAAARVVAKLRKYDRISEVRKQLHWLPVEARIEFKAIMMTWKCLNGMAPEYLSELLHKKENSENLRSYDDTILVIPRTKLTTCGDRAFQNYAPLLWNKVPKQVRDLNKLESFKRQLKTHLFRKYYPDT